MLFHQLKAIKGTGGFILRTIICMGMIASCHNNAHNYENNLGIKPSVIAQIDTANYTKIEWKDTVKNFGIITEGDSVFIKFSFKNAGNTPLFLSEVTASCGCTVANYSQNAVLAGDTGEVTATFNSSYHPGFAHKTITVISNTSNGIQHTLSFTGQVQSKDTLRKNIH